MSRLYAAFAERELPCDFGTNLSGWIPPERPMRMKLDPLQANMAILKNGEEIIISRKYVPALKQVLKGGEC